MSGLTIRDKSSTQSDVGQKTPAWVRQFLNLNSNDVFRKYGLVEDVCYEGLNGHMRMTSLGRSIDTKEKLIALVAKVDNTKDGEIPTEQQSVYHNSGKVTRKTSKTVMSYPPASAVNKKHLEIRSENKCEMCGEEFDLNTTGNGTLFIAHHIYDPMSTDDAVISKQRREDINDMAAVCGTCHQHIHAGWHGAEKNIQLRTKVKTVNELTEWGEVKLAAAAKMEIINRK